METQDFRQQGNTTTGFLALIALVAIGAVPVFSSMGKGLEEATLGESGSDALATPMGVGSRTNAAATAGAAEPRLVDPDVFGDLQEIEAPDRGTSERETRSPTFAERPEASEDGRGWIPKALDGLASGVKAVWNGEVALAVPRGWISKPLGGVGDLVAGGWNRLPNFLTDQLEHDALRLGGTVSSAWSGVSALGYAAAGVLARGVERFKGARSALWHWDRSRFDDFIGEDSTRYWGDMKENWIDYKAGGQGLRKVLVGNLSYVGYRIVRGGEHALGWFEHFAAKSYGAGDELDLRDSHVGQLSDRIKDYAQGQLSEGDCLLAGICDDSRSLVESATHLRRPELGVASAGGYRGVETKIETLDSPRSIERSLVADPARYLFEVDDSDGHWARNEGHLLSVPRVAAGQMVLDPSKVKSVSGQVHLNFADSDDVMQGTFSGDGRGLTLELVFDKNEGNAQRLITMTNIPFGSNIEQLLSSELGEYLGGHEYSVRWSETIRSKNAETLELDHFSKVGREKTDSSFDGTLTTKVGESKIHGVTYKENGTYYRVHIDPIVREQQAEEVAIGPKRASRAPGSGQPTSPGGLR